VARLNALVVERLTLYHRYLAEAAGRQLRRAVTSAEIANALDIDATQVRKDLGAIGLRGRGRVGFDAAEVSTTIRTVLGFDQTHLAVLVGTGHLGGALVAYANFARYGLRVVAAFDSDRAKIGREIAGCPVRHVSGMRTFLARHQIRLAIIATPADAAQEVADVLAETGVEAIWNFAPVRLAVPANVSLRNEHISLGLAHLTYHLSR
jgi:redox-sensing transcriptional repressor